MTNPSAQATKAPAFLNWLADAPMFADEKQIGRFYDAVVQPAAQEKERTVRLSKELTAALKGNATGEVEGTLGNWLTDLLFGASAKATVGLEVEGSGERKSGKEEEIVLHKIETPQRQLVQLALFYLARMENRIRLVKTPQETEWRDDPLIRQAPRLLVFLDFGGQIAGDKDMGRFRAIPTAAEFQDGHIELFYDALAAPNGEHPPKYPEGSDRAADDLIEARKQYWLWFSKSVSPTQAMIAVERAASTHGRIRWIDYRVLLDNNGSTLHLHCSPDCQYDTGTFAYQLIKRGSKHGLRLIGTMRSEPAMNLLAVYEK